MPVSPSSPTPPPEALAGPETANAGIDDDVAATELATPQERLADGRFILLDRLGEGGNAVVWRARDRLMRAAVAVKILRSADPDRQRRFTQEAELLANIAHPNVVRAISRGVTGEGQPYVVLELVAGQSLRALLDAAGPLPWREVLDLGTQIAAALNALHARGVIHRDIKPDNIMLTTDATGGHVVKLIDFGVARLTELYDELDDPALTPPPPRRRTDVGVAIGTPGYMPLEAGLTPPDERFDVYSLGATLYELCTGKLPELGTVAALHEALPTCDAPDDLAIVLAAALALEPDDRTQTAGELGRALAAIRTAHPEHTPSPLHDGRYELIAVLGTGARGDVLHANHRGSRHDVALKLLRSTDPDDAHRFQREAQLLALFEHPAIPRFFDYAPAADPPYITMARAPGVPAANFCRLGAPSRLSPVEVAQVGWQVAQVLAYIHQRGVLHRDVNANNVLIDLPPAPRMNSTRVHLDRTPTVTLVDFGNAELTEKFYSNATPRYLTPPETRIAIPDGNIHTLAWAAPETRQGRPFTAKSDVYSLGLLLYRLLTGKLPTTKHQSEPTSPRVHVPACPNDLAFAILGALNPDPDQRPTAEQLATHLEDALTADNVLDDEATAQAEADDRPTASSPRAPTSPPTLALVVPLHPPKSTAPADPKGWTQFFAATEDPPASHKPPAAAPANNNANVLPLHPRDILQRATTLDPDFAPAAPAPRPPSRTHAGWAATALLAVGALLVWSTQDPAPPPTASPATATLATQNDRALPPAILPAQRPNREPLADDPEQALTTNALAACASNMEASIEVKTSPGEPHFTTIDIDSPSTEATTCLRDALTRLRFKPPTVANTFIKEYWP